MYQVLFRLPIPTPWSSSIPIYGFGTMLVVALFLGTWLAGRRAQKEGVPKEHLQDAAFWIVIFGIIGARVVFLIQYHQSPWDFFSFWKGGLILYGAILGGAVGYVLAYWFIFRKHGLVTLKLADIIAPSAALGICLGRVGCLLNGCCYGNVVANPHEPSIQFPAHSIAWEAMVEGGLQTAAGFTLSNDPKECRVGAVDGSSPAATVAGLQPGDVIVEVNQHAMRHAVDVTEYLRSAWDGKPDLTLMVERNGHDLVLPAYAPHSLALHPTQIYESISMFLLCLLLLAYYPFRRHDGEVMALFLTCYPIHRFLNELLRNDTPAEAFGMTLSENGSLILLLIAAGLWFWILRQPAQYHPFQEARKPPAPKMVAAPRAAV